jgi:hypothetical protein
MVGEMAGYLSTARVRVRGAAVWLFYHSFLLPDGTISRKWVQRIFGLAQTRTLMPSRSSVEIAIFCLCSGKTHRARRNRA